MHHFRDRRLHHHLAGHLVEPPLIGWTKLELV